MLGISWTGGLNGWNLCFYSDLICSRNPSYGKNYFIILNLFAKGTHIVMGVTSIISISFAVGNHLMVGTTFYIRIPFADDPSHGGNHFHYLNTTLFECCYISYNFPSTQIFHTLPPLTLTTIYRPHYYCIGKVWWQCSATVNVYYAGILFYGWQGSS